MQHLHIRKIWPIFPITEMHFKLYYWPAVTCGWFILTFIITYLVAVLNEHVYPLFPYISDTGTYPPESCIFGQMLNIGAVFMAITMYIRYRQVEFAMNSNDINLKRRWNTLAFWSGAIFCLGVSIVGNFQETSVLSVHFIGAFMAFGMAAVYLLVQTRISFAYRHINYKNPKHGVGRNVLYFRLFLLICYVIFYFSVIICSSLAMSEFTGNHFTWWTEDHGGFALRLGGTFSEWLLVLTLIIYVLTVTNEFKTIEYEEIRFRNKFPTINNNTNRPI